MLTRFVRTLVPSLALAGFVAFPTSAAAPVASVLMDSGSPYYVPASVTVTAGAAIRWDNPTPTHHTVTHDGCFQEDTRCAFDSGAVDPDGSYTIPSLPLDVTRISAGSIRSCVA